VTTQARPDTKALRRFFARVTVSDNGCWEWTRPSTTGYGAFSWRYRSTSAHRVAFIWFVGRVLDEHVIDHLCRNTRCVNPAHLEAVTQGDNVRRGAAADRRPFCKRGHAMDPGNIHWQQNYGKWFRTCAICRAAREATRRAKRRSLTAVTA